jgi:hypothetical protein
MEMGLVDARGVGSCIGEFDVDGASTEPAPVTDVSGSAV